MIRQYYNFIKLHNARCADSIVHICDFLISVKICYIAIKSHELCEMCVTCNVIIKHWDHSIVCVCMNVNWRYDDDKSHSVMSKYTSNSSNNNSKQKVKFIASEGKNGYQLML